MENTHTLYDELSDAGYYLVTLRARAGTYLLTSNNERAFVVSQLQDVLRRQSVLENPAIRHQLAGYIDLLVFSITKEAVSFVIFSITRLAAKQLAHYIAQRLEEYQAEWASVHESAVSIRRLTGPHDALHLSVILHLRHQDWEYDRYSSIGFYLHDRRGDWVHLWRISRLYENDPKLYRTLLDVQAAITTPTAESFPLFAPLRHAL